MRLTIGLPLFYCKYVSVSYNILELFDVQNIVTLKSRLPVTQGHRKWHNSTDRIRVPIPFCCK